MNVYYLNWGTVIDIGSNIGDSCLFFAIMVSEFKNIIFEHHSKFVNKNFQQLTEKLELQGSKIDTIKFNNQNFEDLG